MRGTSHLLLLMGRQSGIARKTRIGHPQPHMRGGPANAYAVESRSCGGASLSLAPSCSQGTPANVTAQQEAAQQFVGPYRADQPPSIV